MINKFEKNMNLISSLPEEGNVYNATEKAQEAKQKKDRTRVELVNLYATGTSKEQNDILDKITEHIESLDIDAVVAEANESSLEGILTELNSVKYSSMLNQYDAAASKIEKGDDKDPTPTDLMILAFGKFLEANHVEKKYSVGERITVTLKESDEFKYSGSQFESSKDSKLVEVLTPCWTIKGKVFSKATVREVQ